MLDSNGLLSHMIALSVLTEINKGVKSATAKLKKKQGSYLSFKPEDVRVAQYRSVHGSPICHCNHDILAHKSR